MLRNANALRDFAVLATDGVIGHVDDLWFDDEAWSLRYFVVDTGRWLSGRKVLISPRVVGPPDWMTQQLPVTLTQEQVEGSPDVDTSQPVSRQHEASQLAHYGLPHYWGDESLAGMVAYPDIGTAEVLPRSPVTPAYGDTHLRACKNVTGYQVHAIDGDIGQVTDFLVDDESWAIRYLVVDTGHWWSGQRVLVSPRWVNAVDWSGSTVTVSVTQRAVRDAPPYESATHLDRQREASLHEHYGQPGYWSD
jgi:uncharacterized protein YrrD